MLNVRYWREKSNVSKSSRGLLLEQVAIVKTNLNVDIIEILEIYPNSQT